MNKNILILEDDVVQLELLRNCIAKNYDDVAVKCCTDIDSAVDALNKDIHYDVFLLDISIDEAVVNQNGIDYAKRIRGIKEYNKIPIIFITGYPQFVFDAVNEAHCYSYVIKPYSDDDIVAQLNEVFMSDTKITIRTTNKVYINLDVNDIYYIESMGRYQYFHTVHNEEIKTREHNFKYYEELLSPAFVRCHKSYIINRKYIKSVLVSDKTIVLEGVEEAIPFTGDAGDITSEV
ncbi:MAG: LytTR family DNA-binding domain-containing protein [Lachnospiraceae bacterium]|nr:LytTR family DNA-binding domain-containing protein [Lachnospiraceae bacterium]